MGRRGGAGGDRVITGGSVGSGLELQPLEWALALTLEIFPWQVGKRTNPPWPIP